MSESHTEFSAESHPSIFRRIWQRLVEPHPSLTDVTARRQAQLLAALSLALALFFGFGAATSYFTQGGAFILVYGVAVLIVVYILSRTRFYQVGSILTVLMIIGLAYLNILGGSDDPAGTIYAFIPFAFILASVLLPLPWMIGIVAGTTVINFLFPILNPTIVMREIVAAAGVLMAQGALLIVVTVFRNSLERLRLQEISNANEELLQANFEVQQSTQRVRTMFAALPNGIGVTDLNGRLIEANQRMAHLAGLADTDQLMGRRAVDFITPSDRELAAQNFASGAAVEGSITYRMLAEDGREFDGEITAAALTDDQDQPTGFVIVVRDITSRKQADQALRESRQLLQLVMDNIPQAVFWKNRELTYLGANQAFAEDAGFELPEEIIGKTDFEMPWTEQAALYQADDRRVMMEGSPQLNYEEPQTGPTGETTWLRTSKVPIKDDEGRVFAVLGMYEDITERKKLEQQVQEAYVRRGYQVQISTEISQEIAQASELTELFGQVVTQTKERLGFYHTQVLRYEPAQDAVVLITGYGEIGQKMLAQGHRMPYGSGLIGTAAATGETVMRPDLTEDPDWRANPLLPETQGEIAVPIKLGARVLGVLDVQSNQAGAITDDDRLMLEGLCGQIAIAMEQTRLRQEMADRLEEINRLYRSMSREGWRDYTSSSTLPAGFEYDQTGVRPVQAATSTQSMFAVPLAIPGGAVIGNLAIDNTPENPLSPEDQAFLQQISEQVALALDSARLFEQAQTRSEELDVLNEMGRTLTSLQDEQAIYETIFEYTGKLMDTETFFIATYDRERHEIEMPLLYEAGQMKTMPKQPAGNGLTNYIIQTREPLLISTNYDAQVKELEVEQIVFGDTTPVASWLGVPLVFQDRIIGVVSVQSNTTPGLYTEHDRDLLTAIASQASVALENATVFRQTQQQAEYEAMINQISQRIQSTTSVENALQVAIRELGRALGAKRTNIQLGLPGEKKPGN